MHPKVSVIIPTSPLRPIKCLETIKKSSLDIEVVIEYVKWRNISRARNKGAIKAKGSILIFVNDDIAFEESFLKEFINKIQPGTVVGLDWPLGADRWVVGWMIGIRKVDFFKIGGFLEFMPYMCEDVEFCYRAIKKGFRIIRLPASNIQHLHTNVGTAGSLSKRLMGEWNAVYLPIVYRHRPLTLWFRRKNLGVIAFRLLAIVYWFFLRF